MSSQRLSKVFPALALLVVVVALAVRTAMAGAPVTPHLWTSDPWCFQTATQYQLCAHGR